jgi:hypothetical protein
LLLAPGMHWLLTNSHGGIAVALGKILVATGP